MAGSATYRDDDASMAARAAWMYYAGGLTQSEVARRLGLSSLKAHRLITRANQEGLVKVHIDADVSECVALELAIAGRYGLDYCEVIPEVDSGDLPIRVLGIAGGQFLRREIEGGVRLIGVGHGRTLAASVDHMPRTVAGATMFVSLLGGLTRKFSANPHDVIHRLAERTGAEAYVMPVPMFANTVDDRSVLIGQKGVSEVLDLARAADLLFAGIGTSEQEASLVATGMIAPGEMEAIHAAGGAGELLGHFFDVQGGPVETALSDRALALGREELRNRRIVAVAGGRIKRPAVQAILLSGFLRGLITDEATARSLVD